MWAHLTRCGRFCGIGSSGGPYTRQLPSVTWNLQNLQRRWNSTDRQELEYYVGPLDGTASEHNCYILLHANQPPNEFPMKKSTRISSELQARAIQWKGLVNFAWRKSFATQDIRDDAPSATVYSRNGGRLELPRVSLDNMNEVQKRISDFLANPLTTETTKEAHIYVCTHGERDCRCGSMGKLVVDALEKELERRLLDANPPDSLSRIKIGEVGHIGGHKHAANALVFPHGEWLGQLRPEDAPFILDRLSSAPFSPPNLQQIPDWGNHWRGRMGLSKQEQKDLWQAYLSSQPADSAEPFQVLPWSGTPIR